MRHATAACLLLAGLVQAVSATDAYVGTPAPVLARATTPSSSDGLASPRVDEDGVLRPARWLVLEAVDATGRRPFRPDAVVARHLLDPSAQPPSEGDDLSGELGEIHPWTTRDADENGSPGGGIAWAYAALEIDAPRVVLLRVEGASTAWVNGEPFVGDVYRFGVDGVPVSLHAGRNDLYVTGIRGAFACALTPTERPLVVSARDMTVPDLVQDADAAGPAALLVMNAGEVPFSRLRVASPGDALFAPFAVDVTGLAPLGVRKEVVPLTLREGARVPSDLDTWSLPLEVIGTFEPRVEDALAHGATTITTRLELPMRIVPPAAARRVTFASEIDGSVQFFGLLPAVEAGAAADTDAAPHLVLSLHGAGVDALAQARCYAPRPDRWVVAPTNRRPFGFDWQDWGRQDAYEVLAQALALSGVDRHRVALTGHSMGGHGAWHLAANDADGFSAVAPSAGWMGFDSYSGRPEGELAALWQAADGPSRTLDLIDNLAQMPVFVLHGDADDNVPPSEADLMLSALRAAGAEPGSHMQPGAGHWWDGPASPGTDCLDWPELAELLATSSIPDDPDALAFTTWGPGVDARHHWVVVEQVLHPGALAHVEGEWDASGRVTLHTRNVRRLLVLPREGRALTALTLDGAPLSVDDVIPAADGSRAFLRDDDGWRAAGALRAGEMRPDRCGPFKRAFDRDFVLVVGTAGDASETATLAARARYDAGVWWYRGNGRAEIVSDRELLAGDFAGRDVILYGNVDTNAAFSAMLGDDCPVRVARGAITVGDRSVSGDDLGALFVRPRADDALALVGVLADTGRAGARAGFLLPLFVSGVGFPDWTVYDASFLEHGDGGIPAAGWFDATWDVVEAYVRD